MKEPIPEPCRSCMTPIYPGYGLCDDCEQAWNQQALLDELNREADNARWIDENGPEGHG